jgi:hypothetical protein
MSLWFHGSGLTSRLPGDESKEVAGSEVLLENEGAG